MKIKYKIYTKSKTWLIGLLICASCNKLVDVTPPITSINGENVFNEDQSATAVLSGIYANMSQTGINAPNGWLTNIGFFTGLTGDELKLYNPTQETLSPYYENNIPAITNTWVNNYKMIFIANSALEKLPAANAVTPAIKNQLLGEARFIRALNYFYLVNLYGDVPMALTTDYKINQLLPRTPVDIVYLQIISDLKEAQTLLTDTYLGQNGVFGLTDRIRPNKWAATALLARVYLYVNNYNEAEIQATKVIDKTSLYNLVDIDDVFLKNNGEAIWQLQSLGMNISQNTQDGVVYNLKDGVPDNYLVYLSDNLVDSFDAKDLRRSHWIDSVVVNGVTYHFPFKYKLGGNSTQIDREYSTVLRLGEQYLIRAEARIMLGKINDGVADINVIRHRATDMMTPLSERLAQLSNNLSEEDAIKAVEQERKFELFTEWGHRWMDLKRTNKIDDVLTPLKPDYQPTDKLFPLPSFDVEGNPNIKGHQNPGYN